MMLFWSDYFNTVYVRTWLLNLTTLCEQNEAGKQIAAPQSGFEPTARPNTYIYIYIQYIHTVFVVSPNTVSL